jgi:hypothetical protein
VFRRVERWLVGLAMGAIAFVLEKAVTRSLRKQGEPTKSPAGTIATSRGPEVEAADPK